MVLRYIGGGRSKEVLNINNKVIPYLESLFLRSIWHTLVEKAGKGLKFASRAVIVLFSLLLIPFCSSDGGGNSPGPGGPDGPDLAVTEFTLDQTSVSAGASFSVNWSVENMGNAASEATTLHFYRSGDMAISSSDIEMNTVSIDPLGENSDRSASLSLSAPYENGTYYYGACVDAVKGESNSDNNCSVSIALTVSGASSCTTDADCSGGNGDLVCLPSVNGNGSNSYCKEKGVKGALCIEDTDCAAGFLCDATTPATDGSGHSSSCQPDGSGVNPNGPTDLKVNIFGSILVVAGDSSLISVYVGNYGRS